MRKLLCVFLSVIMIITCTFTCDFAALANEYRQGIDISEHNGDFDLEAQKNAGNSFVMIRLGYYTTIDKYFIRNVQKATELGINFGIYHYSYAFNNEEARLEAEFVLSTLSQLAEEYPECMEYFTLPVAYDLEEHKIVENCNKAQITSNMTVFCNTIRNAGYTPMVYANLNWFTNYVDVKTAVENDYKIWYAYFPNTLPTEFNEPKEIGSTGYYADIWQYGVTDELDGGLDRNVMYSSLGCIPHNYKYTEKITTANSSRSGNVTATYTCKDCGYSYSKLVKTINPLKAFTLSATNYTYNGKVKTPAVTVKDSKGKTLVKGTDYTVSYASGRKNVGKYAVKITFKGNYSGTKTLYFTIKPKNTSISGITAGSKKFTVKIKKYTTQTTGYQIQYATNTKFTKAKTVTVSNKTTSKTISKLAGKKKYYVRIRTYKTVGGTKYYSAWSKYKAVTTKK